MDEIAPQTLEYKILLEFLPALESIRPGDIAKRLGACHSTINSAIKRMEIQHLVKWTHYGSIEILDKGKDALKHIEVHVHLVAKFFIETLGCSFKEAHEESLHLAPHISCALIERICKKYDNPQICPANHPIPEYVDCHKH